MSTGAGWQAVGPYKDGAGEIYWIWSASADHGRRSEAGLAATQDRARELAQDAHRRLIGGVDG